MHRRNQVIVSVLPHALAVVAVARHRQRHEEGARCDEAAIDVHQADKAGGEQPGDDQQRQRQRNLKREQQAARADAGTIAGRRQRAGAERLLDVASGRSPGREDRNDGAGQNRHRRREREDARVDRDLAHARQFDRRGADEQLERRPCDREAQRPAG